MEGQSVNISGIIVDGNTLEDLSGVHVFLNAHIGTVSNLSGKFEFKAKHLDTLYFSIVGYDSLSIVITDRDKEQNMLISMKNSALMLSDVEVTAIYRSNTIMDTGAPMRSRKPIKSYEDKHLLKDYHLGLSALASPMTAIYRLFSKKYKEEKKFYEVLKKQRAEDALFAQASENLSVVLSMTDEYLDDYFYRDFIQFSGLTTRFVAESTEYELVKALPRAMQTYHDYLLRTSTQSKD